MDPEAHSDRDGRHPHGPPVVRRTGWLLSLVIASLFVAGYAIYWLIRSARL